MGQVAVIEARRTRTVFRVQRQHRSALMESIALAVTVAMLACRAEPPGAAAATPGGEVSAAHAGDRELAEGPAVERRLAGGERHAYALELEAGDYLHLEVEQQGVDVVAALIAPGGETLLEIDSPTGDRGPETVFLVAAAAGGYRLEVRAAPGAPAGGYSVRVEARRPATARDRDRGLALAAFAEAENLRRERTPEAYRAALTPYRRAAELFAAAGETARQARALYQAGRRHHQLGEVRAALDEYRRSVERWRSLETRSPELASTLSQLGNLHGSLGEEAPALDALEAALQLARELGDGWREASYLNNLALIYRLFGHPQSALSFYQQALERWRTLDPAFPGQEAGTLSNLGVLYNSLGAPERARILLEEALPLAREAGNPGAEAQALRSLGRVEQRLGRPRAALEHLRRALDLHQAAGDRPMQAATLRDLAWARFELGDGVTARRLDRQALDLFRELGQPAREAEVASDLGWFEAESGDPERALAYLEDALRLHRRSGSPAGEASALHAAARAERRRGDSPAARRRIEQALEIVESLRTRPGVLELRSSYLAGKQEYYELYMDLLIELHAGDPAAGHDVLAFEASERRRARSLLDALTAARALGGAGDAALEAEDRALRRAVDAADRERRRLFDAGAAPATVAVVESRLEALAMAREGLQVKAARVPAAAPPALDLAAAQALLDGDTLLLEFALGESRSFLWSITSQALDCHILPPRAELEALAREAYRLLADSRGRRQRGRLQLVAGELSRVLLGPAAGRLGRKRLVVVGDGALQVLPFAALPVPPGHPAAPQGAEPMLRWHEVVHVPSLPVLAALRRRPRAPAPARGTLVVVADPVFDADDPRIAAPAAGATRAGHEVLGRLPATREEAEAILALVPVPERLALLGFDADRETVTSGVLGDYRFVHFATHGRFDSERPELSGLALSRLDARGRPRDGWMLRSHEIFRLDLRAESVVLSACRSGLGREVRGEGLVGLTQAFLHAGAARVVVSFWPVDDQATAALMERFYRGVLEGGLRPAAALRVAQLSMLAETPWQAPYYWAGFFLQGEWR